MLSFVIAVGMMMNDISMDELNKRCYEAQADKWDRMPFENFLPAAILRYASGKRALDIGSGTGQLAEFLKQNGYDVLCLDPAAEMVKRCEARGLKTIQTTLQSFDTDEKFDLIVAVLSLIHVPKNEMPHELQRIGNWLKPNGTFVLAMIEGQGEGISETNSPYPRFFSFYTRDEIRSLTKDFTCVFERRVGSPISYLVFVLKPKKAVGASKEM